MNNGSIVPARHVKSACRFPTGTKSCTAKKLLSQAAAVVYLDLLIIISAGWWLLVAETPILHQQGSGDAAFASAGKWHHSSKTLYPPNQKNKKPLYCNCAAGLTCNLESMTIWLAIKPAFHSSQQTSDSRRRHRRRQKLLIFETPTEMHVGTGFEVWCWGVLHTSCVADSLLVGTF